MLINFNLKNRNIFYIPLLPIILLSSAVGSSLLIYFTIYLFGKIKKNKKKKKAEEFKKIDNQPEEEDKTNTEEHEKEEEEEETEEITGPHSGELNKLGEAESISFQSQITENPPDISLKNGSVVKEEENSTIKDNYKDGILNGESEREFYSSDNEKKETVGTVLSTYDNGIPNGPYVKSIQSSGITETFEGNYFMGITDGKVTQEKNGYSFKGDYINGKKNGKGEEFYRGHKIFEGSYKDGYKVYGTEWFGDKKVYTGGYLNDTRNGQGTVYDTKYDSNPVVFNGILKHDKFWNGSFKELGDKIEGNTSDYYTKKEYSFKNGIITGIATTYDKLSRVISNQRFDENGILEEELTIDYNDPTSDRNDITMTNNKRGKKEIFKGNIKSKIKPGDFINMDNFDKGLYDSPQDKMTIKGNFCENNIIKGTTVINNGTNNVKQYIGEIKMNGLGCKLLKGHEITVDKSNKNDFKVTKVDNDIKTDAGSLPYLLNTDKIDAVDEQCQLYNLYSTENKKKINRKPEVSLDEQNTYAVDVNNNMITL